MSIKYATTRHELAALFQREQPADLPEDHSGHNDEVYNTMRKNLIDSALQYKYGDPLPTVAYTSEDHATWRLLVSTMKPLLEKHACDRYKKAMQADVVKHLFEGQGVPDVTLLAEALQNATGWTLWPAPGLLSPRLFLNCIALKVFPVAQFIRHPSNPRFSPEPDIFHEVIGHVVMLMDKEYATFSEELGKASLEASDDFITKLEKIYWYTIEIGVCKEEGDKKAYGAAILSSSGEISNCMGESATEVEFKDFTVEEVLETPVDTANLQPLFFVVDSFEKAVSMLQDFTRSAQVGA